MNWPKSLLGSQVWLGPIEPDHLQPMVDWRNSPEVEAGCYRQLDLTLERQKVWYGDYLVSANDVRFIIHAPQIGPVGACGLCNRNPLEGTAELAVYIGEPKARRRGFALDALRTLLDWGFGEWDLRRIGLDVFADNVPAIGLYRRLGFELEGVKRAAHFDARRQEYVDVWIMGLLRGYWEVTR